MNTSSTIKLIAVNCGLPAPGSIAWEERDDRDLQGTGDGLFCLRKLNLDGDGQADLSVHGGADKAVYCFPFAHYDYWKAELPGRDLPLGTFGENFTIDGLSEDSIHIGDRLSIRSAEVVVTQPALAMLQAGSAI